MRRWIAYEHDQDAGWPTEAYLVVSALTQQAAKEAMAKAIADQARTAPPELRSRYWAIFIEAPRELADDDPLGEPGLVDPTFFGFDAPRTRRRLPSPRRR